MDIQQLLEHSDWVRGLAYSLVRDPEEADDVVQETWIAAMRSGPRDPNASRSWLGRVVRNFAYLNFRSNSRRSAREHAAASPESVPSPTESIEKLESMRLLVDLVLSLEEPTRSIVVLRFFEGLTSSAIGERLEMGAGAVRMRLKRALETLRGELERRGHARSTHWTLLVAPLLPPGALAGTTGPAAATTPPASSAGGVGGTAVGTLLHVAVVGGLLGIAFSGVGLGSLGTTATPVVPRERPAVVSADSRAPEATAVDPTARARIDRLEERLGALERRLEESEAIVHERDARIDALRNELLAVEERARALESTAAASGLIVDPA